VGRDPLTDVAVLQIDMTEVQDLPAPATLGSSADLEAGQIVLALGSPLGLARSLSMGVISSTDRYLPEDSLGGNRPVGSLNTWIQTDAAINPGNSGGPLVDLQGRVVGINARAVPIMGENLGFAIPIDVARDVAEALIREGRVKRSWLGVQWQHMKALEGYFGVDKQVGVLAGGIFPDGPAERAGLRAGDLIVALDGEPVSVRFEEELPAFRKRITDLAPGARVALVALRDGKEETIRLRTEPMPEVETDELELAAWGFTVRDLTREMARRMRLDDEEGALVTGVKPDGPAFEAGLRQFDVVRKVGKRSVDSSEELRERYEALLGKEPQTVYMEAGRGRTTRFLLIEPAYD
jgi:serine protease Do